MTPGAALPATAQRGLKFALMGLAGVVAWRSRLFSCSSTWGRK